VDAYRRVNLRLDLERFLQRDVLCVVGLMVFSTVAVLFADLLLARHDGQLERVARREAGTSALPLRCTRPAALICVYELRASVSTSEIAKLGDLERRGLRRLTSSSEDTIRFDDGRREVTISYRETAGGEIVGNQRLPAGITLATVTLAQR